MATQIFFLKLGALTFNPVMMFSFSSLKNSCMSFEISAGYLSMSGF